jgi:hypothetical protein
MSESEITLDSADIQTLDNITLDSADIQTIERFENNYYNHKNKLLQNEKNIIRLYNCFILSQNQNQDELSHKIKKRFNKKFVELKNLEGGVINGVIIQGLKKILNPEYKKLDSFLDKSLEILKMNSIKTVFKKIMNNPNLKTIILNNISTIVKILNNITLETATLPIHQMTTDKIVDTVMITVYNNKNKIDPIIKELVKELFTIINPEIDKIVKEELIIKLIDELVSEFGSLSNVLGGIGSIFGSSSSTGQEGPQIEPRTYTSVAAAAPAAVAAVAPAVAQPVAAKPAIVAAEPKKSTGWFGRAAKPATVAAEPKKSTGWFSSNKK